MGLSEFHCVGGPIDVANDFSQFSKGAFLLLKSLPTQPFDVVNFLLREMEGHQN